MTGRPRIAGSPLGGGGLAALRDQTATGAEGGGTPDKPKSRPFLRRGEGRLGMTTLPSAGRLAGATDGRRPGGGRKTQPVRRSLTLVKPGAARSADNSDADSFDDEPRGRAEPPFSTSYAGLLAQKEMLRKTANAGTARPATAPPARSLSPDEPVPPQPPKTAGKSSAPPVPWNTSTRTDSLAAPRDTAGATTRSQANHMHAEPTLDSVSEAIMRRARGEALRSGEARGGEGYVVTQEQRSPQTAVDFSPVLQAVQGKLATLTQENIGLRDTVATLSQRLADADRQCQQRLDAAEDKFEEQKAEEVRKVTQALRIRDRQQEAFSSRGEKKKLALEVESLKKDLRVAREDHLARESVLTQTIDKLKRKLAQADAAKTHMEEKVKDMEAEQIQRVADDGGLRAEVQLLREELNIALAENARIRGVQAAEAGVLKGMRKAVPGSGAALYAAMHAGASAAPTKSDLYAKQTPTSPDKLSVLGRSNPNASQRSPTWKGVADGVASGRGGSENVSPVQGLSGGMRDASRCEKAGKDAAGAGASAQRASGVHQKDSCARRSMNMSNVSGVERELAESSVSVGNKDDGDEIDRTRSINYRNGAVKEMLADGRVVTRFANGDVKEDCADGSSTYFYREANTTHITYKDGMQLIHFPNNQMEKHYPDGSREVVFPDKTRRRYSPDGTLKLEM